MMKKLLIGAMGALTLLAGGTAAYTVMHATPAYAANAKAVVDQGIAAGGLHDYGRKRALDKKIVA